MQDSLYMDGIRPLIEPESPVLWPPAPIWHLLSAFLLFLFSALLILKVRKWRRGAYRREALRRVEAVLAGTENPGADELRALNLIMKECALTAYPREKVASLSGEAWLNFLKTTGPEGKAGKALERLFEDALYMNTIKISVTEWLDMAAFARGWILRHRPD